MSALPARLSLLRIVAQGLVPATGSASPVAAVGRMLAIQGQQVSAVPHAILSRAPHSSRAEVKEAFDSSRLVRSWPMRGTVHITTAQDHHWLRAALKHRYGAWIDSSAERGVIDEIVARAGELALSAIAERGPSSRAEIIAAWEESGLRPEGEVFYGEHPMSESFARSWWSRHMLLRLHVEGVLAQAPLGSNEHLLIDASRLPDEDHGPVGAGVSRTGPRYREALAEIARRYAMGHGPVGVHDLARWTTLPVGESLRALEDACEAGEDDEGRALKRIRVERGARGGWTPEPRRPSRSDPDVYYMPSDLEDRAGESMDAARATMLLASFDELHVGYKDRSCLTDESGEALICPARNGMFRPIVVDAGRLVAVRPVKEGLVFLKGAPSAALRGRVERAVSATLSRLGG